MNVKFENSPPPECGVLKPVPPPKNASTCVDKWCAVCASISCPYRNKCYVAFGKFDENQNRDFIIYTIERTRCQVHYKGKTVPSAIFIPNGMDPCSKQADEYVAREKEKDLAKDPWRPRDI